MTLSAAIHSMRLRTLPLSLAGVLLGILLACAYHPGVANICTIIFLILTTIALQVLTNMSNELGDFLSGTDSPDRQGPQYSLAEGKITIPEFKKMIVVTAVLCCIFGVVMIWSSFGTLWCWQSLSLLAAGALAIWAAIRYMLGKNNYGSKGFGDISVFIFFGLVSVLGSYFVVAHTINSWALLLPAATIGCFSVGVLNINNIRDMETDSGKRKTIPLRIGLKKARIYQNALIYCGWALYLIYFFFITHLHHSFVLLTFILFVIHLRGVNKYEGKALDKYLPILVISTFIFALTAGLSIILPIR